MNHHFDGVKGSLEGAKDFDVSAVFEFLKKNCYHLLSDFFDIQSHSGFYTDLVSNYKCH